MKVLEDEDDSEDDGFGKECLLVKTQREGWRSCGESVQGSPWDSFCQKNFMLHFFDSIFPFFPPAETLSCATIKFILVSGGSVLSLSRSPSKSLNESCVQVKIQK